MRNQIAQALLAFGVICLSVPVGAQTPGQDTQTVMQSELGQQVLNGCRAELVKYCAEVTPGRGHLLACLFAYEDKLSGECEYALYDAAARLEHAINAIAYVADQCRADIETHCASVQAGQGRVAECLKANRSQLRPSCSQALTDVGMP